MSDINNYVSITEYAAIWEMPTDTIRRQCQRKSLKTAKKIGRNWVIDKNEQPQDRRIKSGEYKDWRKKD